MNDWFEWNGTRCTEYGVHVLTQPSPTMPNERATYTDIPGRSGSLTTLEGEDVYEDITLTAQCIISNPSRIPALAGWLKGGGKVTFANRPGGFYHARIANQIPFEKILRGNPHRSFAVNFRCKPFWYENPGEPITITAGSTVLVNPGSVYSEPVITVNGNVNGNSNSGGNSNENGNGDATGNITLIVNGDFIELTGVSGSITLNSEIQEAYQGETLMNEKMSGAFPRLKPGNNLISWTGDAGSIVIQPNWRYLV